MRYSLGIAMALSAAALTIMSAKTHAQVCNLNDEPVRCFQRYEENVRLLYNRMKAAEQELGRIRARVDLAKAAADNANAAIATPIMISPAKTVTAPVPDDGDTLARCPDGMAVVQVRIHTTSTKVDKLDVVCGNAKFSQQ